MKLSKVPSFPSFPSLLAVTATLALTAALTACPDDKRADAIDAVGGAPGNQADMARQRLGKAEDKLQGNAAAAAAATE